MGEVSLVDEMNSHKHISFHFPSCFAMCSSEPKEAEHRSRDKNAPRTDTSPGRIQKTRTSRQSRGVPSLAVFKAQRPSGRYASRIRKSHELGGAGTRNDTPPHPPLSPGLGNLHPARLFLSSRPGRSFLFFKALSAIRSRRRGRGREKPR